VAVDEINARLNYLHTIPSANAVEVNARLNYLHTIPSANAQLLNARLNYLHTAPAGNAVELNARLNYLHTLPPPPGLYGSASDAIADLPNSGASSPFKSNWDAKRALK
jgi:hypothetical protein